MGESTGTKCLRHDCRLIATVHQAEVHERKDNGAGNADREQGRSARGNLFGLSILLRIQWIVKDGKGLTLLHCDGRGELAAESCGVGVVSEGNQEMIGVGGDPEGEGVHPGELVAAAADFGLRFQPGN